MRLVILLSTLVLLLGCLSPAGTTPSPSSPEPAEPLASPQGTPILFDVTSRAGGSIQVSGLAWWAQEPSGVAVLAIHGSGGTKERWTGLGVPGYSMPAHENERGRAFVAVDLPGYGDSPALDEGTSFEDYAFVIDQVAGALRAGDYVVNAEPQRFSRLVGLGQSMGGLLVPLTEGLFGSFDAIVPMAYSHGGFGEEADACFNNGDCPEDARVIGFNLENADPRLMDAVEEDLDPCPTTACMGFWYWARWDGALDPPEPVGAAPWLDDGPSSQVRVPVLSVLGELDWYFDKSRLHEEAGHYPNAPDSQLLLVEDTGHLVTFHLNQDEVMEDIDDWLDGHGLGRV